MIPYSIVRQDVALSTTADFLTIIAGASRSLLLTELDFQGEGNTSVKNQLGVFRVATAGTTPGGAITPAPRYTPNMTGTTPALAFSGLVYTTWSAAPTLGANVHPFSVNANGQRYFWRAEHINDVIPVPGGNNAAASLSIRSVSGTSNVSGRVRIVEV